MTPPSRCCTSTGLGTCTNLESATWLTASKNLWSRSTSGCSSWVLPTYIPRFQNLKLLVLKFGVIAGWSSKRSADSVELTANEKESPSECPADGDLLSR